MTQISRPLQIALGAVVLVAAVWFIALRGHSSSSESSAPAPAATSASASSAATSSPAASQSASGETGGSPQATKTYHGSAPGVGGLTRAIQKARGAASASEQNAKALQQKATQASGGGSSATQAQQSNSSAASTGGKAAPQNAAKTHSASAKAPTAKTTPAKTANGVPVMQARVEGELKHGDVVALLFWNPHGAVDATVRRELQSASHKLHGKLAIHVARANQVGSFGSFTRTVQVYSTPTILLVNTHAKTASLAGLTDVFSIEQAVREVKSAK
jgi:hypothetical protein